MPGEASEGVPFQSAQNNTGPTVQVAGNMTGYINIHRRPKLPTYPAPPKDLAAIVDPLWAYTPTPEYVRRTLSQYGFAVIAGDHGTGRRTSALRALHEYLRLPNPSSPQVGQISILSPDWDDDEVPPLEILPDPLPGQGYVLDAAQKTVTPAAAQALTSWAARLHRVHSGMVVVGGPTDWPDGRLPEPAARPVAKQVAHNHLLHRLNCPIQAHWLQADPDQNANRTMRLRQTAAADQSHTGGIFANLIPDGVSPADAVSIAERLAKVDPDGVAAAARDQGSTDSVRADQGRKYLQAIQEQVLEWTPYLEKLLAEGGTRGQDRVMLLAASYFEGGPLELCIKAATAFNPRDGQTRQRFREGRSPRRRLREVGVDVTEADIASFASRPGLAMAAIRTDWHHWADERTHTRAWLERVTAPGAVAEKWSKQVGQRLLELSRTAVDPPFFAVLDTWATSITSVNRIALIAELLTEAALTEELARLAHARLLDWAVSKSSAKRQVVAQVCAGQYSERWPSHALVRLRHILVHDDEAARIASTALVKHAEKGGLERIVETIETWLDRFPGHPAGPRAFLALVDPSNHGSTDEASRGVVSVLVTLAQNAPEIRDFLISGWAATLQQSDVSNAAYRALRAWAEAVHQARLDQNVTFGILTEVRNLHTPVDAMSRFLYGSPEHDAPAVVNARYALANLNACTHVSCSHPDCPVRVTGSTAPPEMEATHHGGEATHHGGPEQPSSGQDTSTPDSG